MKRIIIIMLLWVATTAVSAANLASFLTQADTFFGTYVKDGKVAYQAIKNNGQTIQTLYDEVGRMDLSEATDRDKKAFFINAYNLIVIYQVSKYYPLKSPLDQSGFFDKVKHTVAGESMTLNYLEIKKMILAYKDARIHFALACAAISCPSLASFAFTPDNIDAKLTERTKLAINDPQWLMINKTARRVEISKIFDWYAKDFSMEGKTILDFINQYRNDEIPTNYKVSYYEYNWSLNEAG